MAKLSSSQRKNIPKSQFGLPGQGKYPMPDASHAANAKARASQQVKAGNLSPSQKAQVDAKANRVLRRKKMATPASPRNAASIQRAVSNIKSRISNRSKNKTEIGF